MNIFNPSLFAAGADCLPCCTPTCACALLIPLGFPSAPYSDYATATTAIATRTSGCIAFAPIGDTIAASFDGTTFALAITQTVAGPPGSVGTNGYSSLNLVAGTILSCAYVLTTDGSSPISFGIALVDCATGDEVVSDFDTDSTSGTVSITVPTDGNYILVIGGSAENGNTFDFTASTTATAAWYFNPVIALWDDSGTTRQLEACPKLYLPPLTERTGDWYADCASAAAAIAAGASNCIGYADPVDGALGGVLDASGTSDIELDLSRGSGDFLAFSAYASINAVAGDTLTDAWSVLWDNPGVGHTLDVAFAIYDMSGTLVENLAGSFSIGSGSGTNTGSLTSSPLPYTGRYIIAVALDIGGTPVNLNSIEMDSLVSSSGTMTVNPIQALYDVGLTCPARLSCGDSCP